MAPAATSIAATSARSMATGAALAGLLGLAMPARAAPFTTAGVQQAASRCFETPTGSACAVFFDLSDRRRDQAYDSVQYSCYSALLALEAMAARAVWGAPDPALQVRALQDTAALCP